MWPFDLMHRVNLIEARLDHFSGAVLDFQLKMKSHISSQTWLANKYSKVDVIEANQALMSERIRVLEQIIERQQFDKAQDKAQKEIKARSKPRKRVKK